jgi:hypothetical protein
MSSDRDEEQYQLPELTAHRSGQTGDYGPEPCVGAGYFVILVLNVFSLLGGGLMFFGGFNRDGFAAIGEIVIGGQLFSLQFLVGGLPAVVYATKNARTMDKAELTIFILLPVLAMALSAAGIAMAIMLPHHGAS